MQHYYKAGPCYITGQRGYGKEGYICETIRRCYLVVATSTNLVDMTVLGLYI
jgi:hypothetical protein